MKTKFFFLAVAAVALASCSNDETVEVNQGSAISFRPLVNNVTRAADINATTLQSSGFTVFSTVNGTGASYFDETAFTWNSSSASYNSVNKYYWPSSQSLDFFAYAFSGTDGQVSHTAGTKVFTVTPAAAAANQTDLVIAHTVNKAKDGTYDTSKKYGPDGVPLNFRHAESKVVIMLKNTNPNLTFTVENAVIGNVKNSGVYTYTSSNTDGKNSGTLNYSDWIDVSGSSPTTLTSYSQTVTSGSAYSTSTAAQAGVDMILIPQLLTHAEAYKNNGNGDPFEASYITVNLTIQNAKNNAYIIGSYNSSTSTTTYVTALWPLPATTWEPGKKYTYTVDLAGGGYYPTNQDGTTSALDPILDGAEIKFVSVTVDDWVDYDGDTSTDGIQPIPVEMLP